MQTEQTHISILTRLAAARTRDMKISLLTGALLFLVISGVMVILVVTLEGALRFGIAGRTALFWSTVVLCIALFGWLVGVPLLRFLKIVPQETDEHTAARVGSHFPHIADRLLNTLQLFRERKSTLYSPSLVDASIEDADADMSGVDFSAFVDTSQAKRTARIFGIVGFTALVLIIGFPSVFVASAQRLLHYGEEFAEPTPFSFAVEPGNAEVVKGQPVTINVRVIGETKEPVRLLSRPRGQVTFDDQILERSTGAALKHEFSSVKSSTEYFVQSGDVRSPEFTLTVLDRPALKSLRLSLQYPAYTKLAPRELDENIGDVTALKGTRISLSVESNKELAEVMIVFNDSTRKALDVKGEQASGSIPLMRDGTYHVYMRDTEGLTNADPIEYTLRVTADAFPAAEILVPGPHLDIAGEASLNTLFKITDDFGFSQLRLAYRLTQSRYERPAEEFTTIAVPLGERSSTEEQIPYVWSLEPLRLVPEDVVSYYIEVFDNDRVSGPKSARSATHTLRLPSLDEVFADLDRGHETSLESMKEALEEAQEAKKDLDELQQDLRKNQQKMDWQQQQKAQELAKKYEEIQKKLDDVNATVDRMTAEMQKNQVLSKETMEKYQELQRMMEEMNSPEFTDALKKLQQSMQQMSPEQMRQALQEFKFSEENFRESLERTMNLLKRLQIEQKTDEVVKRAEEIKNTQEELQKQTEQTNPQDRDALDKLAKEQQDLKEQLEALEKEMAGLEKKMEDFPSEMPLEEMSKAMEEMEQSQLDQQMQEIAQQLQQQQMSQAMKGQRSAMQKMGSMMQQLQQMQKSMMQNQQQQVLNAMRKSLEDMLELSKRQEGLKKESQSLDQNSARFRENAQEQMDIMRDLSSVTQGLSELSQRTFSISPDLGKSIGDAMRQMDQAMQSLQQRNGNMAGQQQGGAMASLNQAASQLQGSMNSMMQGGSSGMGMAGFMQRLQQMSSQQQGINQGTQNLGGMTPQQAAEMGRLAGEQGMVRKSLEQLAREAAQTGDLSKMLGDLNRAAQEMREVQTDLAQGNVNPETLRKQERILSRLLDSQRSARERDFEKKRLAESGKDVRRTGPQELNAASQDRDRLRRDLLKAMEEGYSKDYQDIIRKYFEALEQAEPNR